MTAVAVARMVSILIKIMVAKFPVVIPLIPIFAALFVSFSVTVVAVTVIAASLRAPIPFRSTECAQSGAVGQDETQNCGKQGKKFSGCPQGPLLFDRVARSTGTSEPLRAD